MKTQYTEEQMFELVNILKESAKKDMNLAVMEVKARNYIRSLQKVPKYIVIESKYKDGYGNWFYYDKKFWDKHDNKPKFGVRPKLTSNSEGKQECVIKEIIYDTNNR